MTNQISVYEYVAQQERHFVPALTDETITWEKEKQFACQLLESNSYLLKTAQNNQQSLQNAIVNIASIGISLNPATKHAYLVPRDGKVCLDISYIGLMHLAMQTGSITFGQAKIVYSNDVYVNKGLDKAPEHTYSPFADRGEPIGAYCTVKLPDGDFITEEMSKEQILAIRDNTASYKAFVRGKAKSCIWVDHELEMWRKTVVKRASKYWPTVERLQTAIDYLNNAGEGIDREEKVVNAVQQDNSPYLDQALFDKNLESWLSKINSGQRSIDQLVAYVNKQGKELSEQQLLTLQQGVSHEAA